MQQVRNALGVTLTGAIFSGHSQAAIPVRFAASLIELTCLVSMLFALAMGYRREQRC
jgi:hypothetical protein